MSKRTLLWLTTAALYAAFFFWYTDTGGPLSRTEIDEFMAALEAGGANPETIAFMKTFASEDTGRQFLMVNNIDLSDNPPNVEGAEPGASAAQLMSGYMEYMFPALLSRASHPVIVGPAVYPAMDLVGIEGAEIWDQSGLVRYRSRRTLLEIVSNPAFQGRHDFKTAALEKTIAYPIEPQLYLGDPRLLLALILVALTALIDGWLLSRALNSKT